MANIEELNYLTKSSQHQDPIFQPDAVKVEICEESDEGILQSEENIYDYDEKKIKLEPTCSFKTEPVEQTKCFICILAENLKKNLANFKGSVQLKIKEHNCTMRDHSTKFEEDLKPDVEKFCLNGKNHKCNMCDYDTNSKGSLRVHIERVHMNMKKHKCSMCDYAANIKEDLKRHVQRVHVNMRRHKCSMCNYSANMKGNLKSHVERMHGNRRKYRCSKCVYVANMEADLKRHIQRIHMSINTKEHHLIFEMDRSV